MIAYIVNNIVYELIPKENPVFPGVPVTDRYTAEFLTQCVEVPTGVEVAPNDIYDPDNHTFTKPTITNNGGMENV